MSTFLESRMARAIGVGIGFHLLAMAGAFAQDTTLPFGAGERLHYRVSVKTRSPDLAFTPQATTPTTMISSRSRRA